MNTLINELESWLNDKIKDQLDQMEEIHIRDANRIASLERSILELQGDQSAELFIPATEQTLLDFADRLDTLESGVEEAFSLADTAHDLANELEERVDTLEGAENNEAVIEDMIDRCVDTAVRSLTFNITAE